MRTLAVIVALATVLAGCASVADQAPVKSPDPIYGSGPAINGSAGVLHMTLAVSPTEATIPANVVVSLGIETTNSIGQPLPGNVTWRIEVDGPKATTATGTGKTGSLPLHLTQRGTYQVTATAKAAGFADASVSKTILIDPKPLVASINVTEDARGAWFILTAEASQGFSDISYECQWAQSAAIQIVNASSCGSSARWLKDGNQTITVRIDDGHGIANTTQTIDVQPLPSVPVPTAAPGAPLIVDDPAETQAPQLNLTAAWVHSDLDRLYIGIALKGIPHAQATRDVTYSVAFTPSWNATLASGTVEQFRVTATHPLTDADGKPVADGPRFFALDAKVGDAWEKVGEVAGAEVSTANGIVWWPADRSMLQTPLDGASISGINATAKAAADPATDTASTEAIYALV